MTLFELQEHCLANAVEAVICGDTMTINVSDIDTGHVFPSLHTGRGYLDEPCDWITTDADYDYT